MALSSAVFLAVCAFFVASGVSSADINPGMTVYCTDEGLAMWYKDAVFGDELKEKSKNATLTEHISGNVSTLMGPSFGYDLANISLKDYTEPEVQALITTKNGIEMMVKVAEMSVEGNFKTNYNIKNWPLYYGMGNFTMTIRETVIRMVLNTSFASSDLESVRYESVNRTCSVKDLDIVFDDSLSSCLLTLVDDQDLENLVGEKICELYELLTEPIFNASYNLTQNIRMNKEFLQQPIAHDGYIEARHKGVVYNTAGNEEFKPLPGPMEPMKPRRMKVYCMQESLFNSAAFVIHQEKLLWDTYTTSDLPKGQESLLKMTTSCGESICFDTLFPNATIDHAKSTVELNVSTADPPNIKITEAEFTVNLTLDTEVFARHENNGDVALLFSFRHKFSAPVEITIKDSNVYFKMQRPISNIDVVNSTIGQLNEDHLKLLAELSYLKVLYPAIERFCQVGFPLGVPYPFSAARSEVELRNGNVCLMYDFVEN